MRRFVTFFCTCLLLGPAACGGDPGAGPLPDARPGDGSVSQDASPLADGAVTPDGALAPDADVPDDGGAPDDGGIAPDGDVTPDGGGTTFSQCGLLTNGDAESGDIAGWTVVTGELEAVQSMVGVIPTPYQGSYAFGAGEAALSEAEQVVDVSAWATTIDGGDVYVALTGWLRTWNGNDQASLQVAALDGSQQELAVAAVGPYSDDQWMQRSSVMKLPVGTRAVVATLRGERNQGTDNDAYFDGLDLCLTQDPPPPSPDDFLSPVYLMWSTQDSVSVRWETATATLGHVEYGPTPALGSSVAESAPTTVHEVRLTGLPTGQTTYYRVAWQGAVGEVSDFVTAPQTGSTGPFTFLVWGDNQDGVSTFNSIVTQMLGEGASFALSVGDVVQSGTRANYRDQFLGPFAPLADHVPFLVAEGNHSRYTDTNAALFDEYFSQPADEHCFGWQWGNVYFLLLDSDLSIDPGSDQDTCIRDALNSAEAQAATFRVALFHKPPRIEWWYGGAIAFTQEMEAPWIRTTLEPLLESLDVNLVFNGHNHLYAYTPMTAGGITFATTGGGGGSIDTDFSLWRVATWPEITVTLHEHHFLSVTVNGNTISVDAVDPTGQVIHSFQVTP